jgi:hypothetical protein
VRANPAALLKKAGTPLGLDAPEKVQEVGPVSDAKATLLAKWNKMAERMRPAEIAAPLKDVTPLIEHEPSADANVETSMIRFVDAGEPSSKRDAMPAVTPAFAAEAAHVTQSSVTKSVTRTAKPVTKTSQATASVTKRVGRPKSANPLTPAERQRLSRERRKAKD